jgi:hypothetical protein
VLKEIFGHKNEDVTDIWRKLHNETIHNLYLLTYLLTHSLYGAGYYLKC